MVGKCVAVFGRADASSKDMDYKEAFACASKLSQNGFSILTGGYGGIMRAASKGAIQSNGNAIGVPCILYKSRKPNPYLTKTIWARNLYERQKILIENADGFVAFEPKAGTLSEVSLIFALRKNKEKATAPLCLVGEKWFKIITFFEKERIIPKNLLKYTFLCRSGSDASNIILNLFQ